MIIVWRETDRENFGRKIKTTILRGIFKVFSIQNAVSIYRTNKTALRHWQIMTIQIYILGNYCMDSERMIITLTIMSYKTQQRKMVTLIK